MKSSLDPRLHWTDHYVQYGFAIVKSVVTRDYASQAVRRVAKVIKTDLPLNEWSTETIPTGRGGRISIDHAQIEESILHQVYHQSGVRAVIDTMFGSPDAWNGERMWKLFVSAYDPALKPQLARRGHIDFVDCPVPILGSGFIFQLSLVDTEPFSGNLTIYPGTHKILQKCLMDNHDWRYPRDQAVIPDVEPFEFVAEAGDALIYHHLVFHEGNANYAVNRSPRVSLACQGLNKKWLTEVDANSPNLSPWERSLTLNGSYMLDYDEQEVMERYAERRRARANRVA